MPHSSWPHPVATATPRLLRALQTALAVGALVLGSTPEAQAEEVLRFEHLTVADGLADDTVNDIVQDGLGFMWFATPDGLSRFDGSVVRTWVSDPDDPHSLPHNDVRALAVDGRGELWVATRGGGLARYDVAEDRFTVWREDRETEGRLQSDFLSALAFDDHGGLWVGTRTHGLARMDLATETFERFLHAEEPGALREPSVATLLVDRQQVVWVGTGGALYRFDAATRRFQRFEAVDGDARSLPHNRVLDLHEDPQGRLWVATQGGLAQWDRAANTATTLPIDPDGRRGMAAPFARSVIGLEDGSLWLTLEGVGLQQVHPDRREGRLLRPQVTDPHSLAHAATDALFIDRTGVLWVGSDGGVDRHDPATQRFRSYRADPERPEGFSQDDLWGIDQTADGAIWLATDSAGVVRFDPDRRTWTQFRHDPDDPSSLASDRIFCLFVDSADRVWVGTANRGLDVFDPVRNAWRHHQHRPDDDTSISRNEVYSLTEGIDGRIWIGLRRGFDLLDPQTGRFTHPAIDPDDPDGGMLATAFDVAQGNDGLVWAATFLNGLYSLDLDTREWTTYRPDEEVAESLGSMRINVLLIDGGGTVWAGTNVGLFRHLGSGNRWRRYARKHGLANETVTALLEGPDQALWIGTSHGLFRLDPQTHEFRGFTAEDGLPDSEVAWHALARLQDDRIAVGTAAGFALFDPARIDQPRPVPSVVLTGIERFNEPLPLQRGDADSTPRATLARTPPLATSLLLGHQDSVLTLEFAGLEFSQPERLRYSYRLDGWDDEWLTTTADRRFATYTNLPAGTYRFQARAAHAGGEWGPPSPALAIKVLPPPWRTWWAYTLYALALLGLLAALIWTLHARAERQRLRAEREAEVNRHLRRVDKLKDEFLANTSHELRTPLHGIIGLAESLVDGATGPLPSDTRDNLEMIVASGRRLGSLIDDLLDFSKLRNRGLDLQRGAVDLHPLVDIVLRLNRPLLGSKDLVLLNQVPKDLPPADADENRLQQILHNLVGNAIKFTPKGEITVAAELVEDEIVVRIRDTGIGIEADDLERIFLSFEQVEGGETRSFSGTGLGLAITRDLVELHGGTVDVESTPGAGSCFSFTLPRAASDLATRTESGRLVVVDPSPATSSQEAPAASVPARRRSDGPPSSGPDVPAREPFKVLVVDDEPVNRQVLVNQLGLEAYRLIEAPDGEQALAAIEREAPDLVLLDIMMPKMSGYDVCRTLRRDRTANEMPVIYLSAKSQVSDLEVGFETGANDYLTKPVSRGELLARVQTHLELLDAHRNLERLVQERTRELHDAHLELEHLAARDGLTGLTNRRYFDEALERAWQDHQSRGATMAVLMLDIDYFKRFNDHYGHLAGDETLRAVAEALHSVVRRAEDMVSRYGGEEFVFLLHDTDADGARAVADLARRAVEDLNIPHERSDVASRVTVSLGFAASVPRPSQSADTLVDRADRGLYRAKEKGRNRVEAAPSEDP